MQAFLLRTDNLKTKKPNGIRDLKSDSIEYSGTGNNQYLETTRIPELESGKIQHFQKDKEILIFHDIKVAESFFSKLTGLIFKKNLKEGSGLLIENCNNIHTLWMRFSIDVLYLDENGRILHILHSVKPFRFTSSIKGAVMVLEIKSKTAAGLGLQAGDILRFK
ncbi:MAG: DUF192 domain-containing protein [Actinobacteria bacterium]|nr:DUF192 domain-containing protein [Actinomycetota bacterium]MBM3712275.1 DUF192 domain-containing protein [Actinomycetota bacterium]